MVGFDFLVFKEVKHYNSNFCYVRKVLKAYFLKQTDISSAYGVQGL